MLFSENNILHTAQELPLQITKMPRKSTADVSVPILEFKSTAPADNYNCYTRIDENNSDIYKAWKK